MEDRNRKASPLVSRVELSNNEFMNKNCIYGWNMNKSKWIIKFFVFIALHDDDDMGDGIKSTKLLKLSLFRAEMMMPITLLGLTCFIFLPSFLKYLHHIISS